MPSLSFRDRFFTPPVARAIMSPLGILLAGVGTAGAVLAGIPLVGALGVGAVAWAGRVLLAVPKSGRAAGGQIDPYTLTDPWRSYVIAAQGNRNRFERTVKAMRPGPLRERLDGVTTRFDDAVEECWRVASRGHDIESVMRTIDARTAQAELDQVRRLPPTPATAATVQSLEAQLASAKRMYDVADDARNRLRLLDARMDEMIARAAELTVTAGDDLHGLDADVDGLVDELEALRRALEETGQRASLDPAPGVSLDPGSPDVPGATPPAPGQAQAAPGAPRTAGDDEPGGWAMPSRGT